MAKATTTAIKDIPLSKWTNEDTMLSMLAQLDDSHTHIRFHSDTSSCFPEGIVLDSHMLNATSIHTVILEFSGRATYANNLLRNFGRVSECGWRKDAMYIGGQGTVITLNKVLPKQSGSSSRRGLLVWND